MRAFRRGWLRPGGRRCVALVLLAAAALTGCTKNPTVDDPLSRDPNEIRLYGADGNMLNAVGERLVDAPDGLAGMKGTTPLTRLPAAFKAKVHGVDPGIKDYSYTAETYDAVVISALATQIAGTTDPKEIAEQINGVTVSGTSCQSPSECLHLIKEGGDVAYQGISLKLGGFTDAGEPSATTYGILRFAGHNQVDDQQTEFVPAGDASRATKRPAPAPHGSGASGPLRIGALLPHTGQLAGAGPPMFAAALLAVREINDAGGVLGRPVVWIDGDDHTDPDLAKKTATRLINAGAQVIIGAGASSITKAVLPVTMAAGVILFSPCNTAAELSTIDDQGLYFRTAPPDNLQAAALTDIIMRDGVRRIYIIARDDAYGDGLMNSVRDNLLEAGLAVADVKTLAYDVNEPDFTELGTQVKDYKPDGVLVIGFDESADILGSIIEAGLRSHA